MNSEYILAQFLAKVRRLPQSSREISGSRNQIIVLLFPIRSVYTTNLYFILYQSEPLGAAIPCNY